MQDQTASTVTPSEQTGLSEWIAWRLHESNALNELPAEQQAELGDSGAVGAVLDCSKAYHRALR